jgi:acyl carrier protein
LIAQDLVLRIGAFANSPPPRGAQDFECMEPCMSDVQATPSRIKQLIVTSLNLDGMRPEMIEDDAPLFGEGLGLDSVDALELVVALEKEFGIKIKSQEIGREVFSSVTSLSQYIEGRT